MADAYNEGMAYALGEFLKVMDNMERALAAAKEAENEAIAGGIQLSMDSFLKAFEKHGFARIESDGAEFDPNLHNAVMQTPTEDDALRGKVAQTLQVEMCIRDRHRGIPVAQRKRIGGRGVRRPDPGHDGDCLLYTSRYWPFKRGMI